MINIFPLLLNSDPQILPITGGASGSLEIRLQFETLPSAGFISTLAGGLNVNDPAQLIYALTWEERP